SPALRTGAAMSTPKRVVVTGYGALCSLGETSAAIWEAIRAQRMGYRYAEPAEKQVQARFFGFLEPNPRRLEGFPKSLLRALPAFARHALVAGREALRAAFPDGPGPGSY